MQRNHDEETSKFFNICNLLKKSMDDFYMIRTSVMKELRQLLKKSFEPENPNVEKSLVDQQEKSTA